MIIGRHRFDKESQKWSQWHHCNSFWRTLRFCGSATSPTQYTSVNLRSRLPMSERMLNKVKNRHHAASGEDQGKQYRCQTCYRNEHGVHAPKHAVKGVLKRTYHCPRDSDDLFRPPNFGRSSLKKFYIAIHESFPKLFILFPYYLTLFPNL